MKKPDIKSLDGLTPDDAFTQTAQAESDKGQKVACSNTTYYYITGEIMERKSKVTQSTVNAACEQLQADSKNVTVNAIISITGGSFSTVVLLQATTKHRIVFLFILSYYKIILSRFLIMCIDAS
jgi:hypothetical protein